MSLMNTWFGLVCLGVISWFSIRKPEKVILSVFVWTYAPSYIITKLSPIEYVPLKMYVSRPNYFANGISV